MPEATPDGGAATLLIAVVGPVGSGKTTLLSRLAAWMGDQGRSVTGFVAEAGERPEPGRGAAAYGLRWLDGQEPSPYARRDDERTDGVPYRFEPEAEARVAAWAEGLAPGAALVVLDEFGRLEAAGEGHARHWAAVLASAPAAVAVAVREELLPAFEARWGHGFDVVVDARAPRAFETLCDALRAEADWRRIGVFGAASGGLEVTLGAALHGALVPCSGLVMSSAQAMTMTWAADGLGRRARVVWVPFIAAGLKALSPAGGRVRPMLAITIQGLLYAAGVRGLGYSRAGVAVAAGLVGAWAAAQGVLIQWVLVGHNLLRAYAGLTDWLARHGGVTLPSLAIALGLWVAAWAAVAGAAGAWAYGRLPHPIWPVGKRPARPSELAEDAATPGRRWGRAALRALSEMTRVSFWGPLGLVAALLLAEGAGWKQAFWMGARAVTIGFVVLALVQACDPRGLVRWLRRRGHWGPAMAFAQALAHWSAPVEAAGPARGR